MVCEDVNGQVTTGREDGGIECDVIAHELQRQGIDVTDIPALVV
jgi:hypothetical protein